jgi:hypothetical protein
VLGIWSRKFYDPSDLENRNKIDLHGAIGQRVFNHNVHFIRMRLSNGKAHNIMVNKINTEPSNLEETVHALISALEQFKSGEQGGRH